MQRLPIALYRTAQIKELERIVINERGISGFELMTRAGYAVFQHICKKWSSVQSVAVFCGSGNNAGDGYITAGLALEAGMQVTVYMLSDPEQLSGDALTAYQQYVKAGGTVTLFQPAQAVKADVLVDALLGTGLDRPVTGLYAEAIQAINKQQAPVIAIDIPSGLNADTGNIMDHAVHADCTMTFIGIKQGLLTGQAAEHCGEIIHASLDVPEDVFRRIPPAAHRIVHERLPRRSRYAYKGNYGHVLVIGGGQGYLGAVRLAGEAALRTGTGLVSIATRPEHAAIMNLTRPELMCHGVENGTRLTALLEKISVVVVGPGLGQTDWAKDLFMSVITSKKNMVIDADALNILSNSPAARHNLQLAPDSFVLTPHAGEAARLLSSSAETIQQDRFAAAYQIQRKYGGVIVLKGSGTLIASRDTIGVSTTGNPGMASGGIGDVLSGVIAGLLAQGLSLKEAAEQGVYIHGLAADLAVATHGERGLLASDLMPYLRDLVN